MAKEFITSDHHFGHNAILTFEPKRLKDDGTQFKDIKEHDQYLINKWNSIVSPEDTVYYLGDFAYKCNMNYAQYCFWSLNGKKILICGNHDNKIAKKFKDSWNEIYELFRIDVIKSNGVLQHVLLSHRPFLTWENNCWHFHGHTHGKIEHLNNEIVIPDYHSIRIRKNIGIDTNNGYPYKLEDLIKKYES